jgi:alpha-L-rhamnosidase
LRPRLLLLSSIPIVVLTFTLCARATTLSGLRCEYAENPLGIDVPHPRLSWTINSERRGEAQTAYQVLVASSPELLKSDRGDVWDTGKVMSDQSVNVPYGGSPLRSRQRCFWKVRIWDREGRASAYSETAWWEIGLLSPGDWKAVWIGFTPGWTGRALYFRSLFEVTKKVERARVYVAGLGYYELRLNGKKVGNRVLDPGTTDYSRRILYATYDVTGDLRNGKNAAAAVVGHGWYGIPKLLLQMEITYEDGSSQLVYTGPRPEQTWQVTSGPIVRDSIYDGETYDARLEKPDWDIPPEGNPRIPVDRRETWITLHPVEPPGGRLVAAKLEPIEVVETLRPVSVTQPKPNVFVFDNGQNLAGWARIRVKGAAGTQVTLRFAENLYPDGSINQENLRQAAATDTYILRGEGLETWEPRFTYHGFRYVQVEGFPGNPTLDDIDVRVVRSAVDPSGSFKCGNDLINRIQKMIWWTEASNLHSIPTDCPQRDERMGWLNDMTVRTEMALYNFNLARLYAKFIDDVQDTQSSESGAISCTAPFKYGRRPADPVSASYLLLAWMLYQHYGDAVTMAEHYDGLKAWVDFLARQSENGIVNYSYYGDWSPPQAFAVKGSAVSQFTPGKLMSTGYLYYGAVLLQRMADILGRPEDATHFRLLAGQTATAFNREYWNETTGGYASNNQASNSFALFLGIVPSDRIPRVVDNLVKDVEKHGYHLTTGNLCTKYVLEMLTEHGHPDLAYRIATQETYPSWGYMLANGATTLWERWEQLTGGGMNSGNHPMMGSVGSWFYKYLAGIRVDPSGAGFRKILIQPSLPAGLDWAEGSYKTLYGEIRSAWKREGKRLRLDVRIPANTSATVTIPVSQQQTLREGGQPIEGRPFVTVLKRTAADVVLTLGSGDYTFQVTSDE